MSGERTMKLAGVPAQLVFDGAVEQAAGRGTVLLLHGLGGHKERQRVEADALAGEGYLAVALDAVGHGQRRYVDFARRFAPATAEQAYLEVVRETARELPAVVAALSRQGLAFPGAVGAVGFSMGGAALFGSLSAGLTMAAAATLMSSPRWPGCADSPDLRPERFFPTALLIQTAAADTIVPPEAARRHHAELTRHYAQAEDRLRYVEHAGEGHMLSATAWKRAWSEVLSWLDRHLAGKTHSNT